MEKPIPEFLIKTINRPNRNSTLNINFKIQQKYEETFPIVFPDVSTYWKIFREHENFNT